MSHQLCIQYDASFCRLCNACICNALCCRSDRHLPIRVAKSGKHSGASKEVTASSQPNSSGPCNVPATAAYPLLECGVTYLQLPQEVSLGVSSAMPHMVGHQLHCMHARQQPEAFGLTVLLGLLYGIWLLKSIGLVFACYAAQILMVDHNGLYGTLPGNLCQKLTKLSVSWHYKGMRQGCRCRPSASQLCQCSHRRINLLVPECRKQQQQLTLYCKTSSFIRICCTCQGAECCRV